MPGLQLGLGLGLQRHKAGGGSSAPVAPANTVLPAITGTAKAGQTLSCSTGTWTGTAPISYAYQWKADGANISGATASSYLLTASEVGKVITCTVTATNAAGNVSATSAATAAVTGVSVSYLGRITTSGGSIAIGSAAADCLIVCAMDHKRSGVARTLTSMSIAGTNGTIHGQVGDATVGEAIAIVSRLVTGGGTIAISWVLSGAVSDSGVDIWRIDGLASATPTDTMFPSAGNDPSGDIDFPSHGAVIGIAASNGQNAFTWTGLTKQTDANMGGTAIGRYSSAYAGQTVASTGVAVGVASASAAEAVGAVAWA